MIDLAFTGRSGLGGVCMRGRDVAQRLGVPFYDLTELPPGQRFRTLVLVKYPPANVGALRLACDQLVCDPLDVFSQLKPKADPVDFWRWFRRETGCDAMLATSPAVQATMEAAGVPTILAPHAADPRIGEDWHDPSGFVVYAGGERFLGRELPAIHKACKRLGRELVTRFDRECWLSLEGAALSLCVRFGEERTPLNLVGKPLVKVANAARAGIPVLATSDAAITSMVDCEIFTGDWEADITAALKSDPPHYPHDLAEYARYIGEQLCTPTA